MSATLGALLANPELGMHVVGDISPSAAAQPLQWAHSSDLGDPTPWLRPGGLLLTDGVQFLAPQSVDPRTYTARLVEGGVCALGFATSIVHADIPAALIAECRRQHLPLIEVDGRTPFMRIIREVSDAVASSQRAVLESSLRAQRSIARAALRPDALQAILRELQAHLGSWAALYDASGQRLPVEGGRAVPAHLERDISLEVSAILRRGRATGAHIDGADATHVTLQTIGNRGSLRGVLAVGTSTRLERGEADLVESVIALASISLEQGRALELSRRALRTGVLELLTAGAADAAARPALRLGGGLPPEPFRVVSISVGAGAPQRERLVSALDSYADRRPGLVFFGEFTDEVVVTLNEEGLGAVEEIVSDAALPAGEAAASTWQDFPAALAHAREAASWRDGPGITPFDAVSDSGFVAVLERFGGREVAERMLAPISTDAEGKRSRDLLRAWLEANGAWDPAARAVGMHRHSLKARIERITAVLGLDIDSFDDRTRLWTALRLADAPSSQAGATRAEIAATSIPRSRRNPSASVSN